MQLTNKKWLMISKLISTLDSKSESFYHKAMKELIYKFISKRSNNILESSKEKYFKNHRADVYFKLKSGQEIVVEVQHSKITIKEINKRTKYYNDQGIHVLWILHGKGKCVGDIKRPKHKKNVKLSTAEKFLHTMYGRVYYVNINKKGDKTTITPPFALHFSLSSHQTGKAIKEKFESFFTRNTNTSKIPSRELYCTTFRGIKIARFYDKNVKIVLEKNIMEFINRHFDQTNFRNFWKARKLIRTIFHQYDDFYGELLIIDCLNKLHEKKKITINKKMLLRKKAKFSSR